VSIRCRFAPSPTGYLHVGSARTALFNWLFARHCGATFVLRIEDTDASRNQPELVDNILDSLRWLGLDWDEGPYHQSERAARHAEVIERLLDDGRAYIDDGAVRLRVDAEGTIGWDDVIRGPIRFDRAHIEDFVIRRSDGSALFLLTNVVDDADMGITHVIRGEDMINNMPKQLLLLEAMGLDREVTYAHVPLLVDEQRRKLSKRFGDVAIERYRDRGFLPAALCNYLATLGWGTGDGVEIRPIEDIIERFELHDVNASSAFFDIKKLTHFNGEYIRMLPLEEFTTLSRPFAGGHDLSSLPVDYQIEIQGRTKVLEQLADQIDWLFTEPTIVEEDWSKVVAKTPSAADMLDGTVAAYAECPWEHDTLQRVLAEVGERHGLKPAKAQAPVRVAVTGRSVGPPLFQGLEVIGRERTLDRLRAARARL
jgi:glutamyl-tRNA synthetase